MSTPSTSRFWRLRPKVEKLMDMGRTPGLAVVVMQHGDILYEDSFGDRDLESSPPLKVDNKTIFPGASLTKAVTAAAFGTLVDEGKAAWNTPVKDLLPSFNSRDETLQNFTTVTDLLCHRHGMAWSDGYAVSCQNNCLIPRDDVMRFINDQERLLPFRGQFNYNNNGYELVGKIIEQLSGLPYIKFVQRRIFDPLGMDSTWLTTPPSTNDNVAKAYNVLSDATPVPITPPQMGDDWWGAASGGMRSNIVDLLKLYQFFLKAFNYEETKDKDKDKDNSTSPQSPSLRQGPYLMSARIPLDTVSRHEASYAMGWARVQLPGRMGQIGMNPRYMPKGMPVVGKGVRPQLAVFHQGSLVGAFAFACLLPDTESIIVVLSNALPLHDVPDFVGQLMLEELLDVPESERVDFVEAAEVVVETNLKWHPRITKQLEEQRTNGTSPRDLWAYVGTYWDRAHVFKIVVTLEDGKLYRALQGLETEKFQLHHYEHDTFTWFTSRDELSSRGRWVGDGAAFYKHEFKAGDDGGITSLFWVHDGGVPIAQFHRLG